ncbi:C-terminal processing protease CtpA/Prc, contains a PDZ domain [Flavobacterium resistens]|uniref:C-terminal processing protease CtpA/Prc, contains a PDZ domain n=1 Tax=Flavobacterium resistens TaxID=443612 RepID=A0A521C8C7_9FLAO|nr:S41 family peptidase [Flavobacterium resistens]MRX66407.1 peptidase S41 [Flavobacterium resistens]SMO55643.1 C-terminal processing protease CtpA/Prc, contains a PDZ domain [Flavobacterium resistens]
MQRITVLVLVLFSQTIFSSAKITETEKLVATCKVWGFLKYYHPEVAGGKTNWDNQLLEKLPKIEKAQTKEEFSLILENWIDELGPVKEIAPIPEPKGVKFFDKNFDLSWINSNKLFSKKLSKKLKFIEENRFQTTEEIGPGYNPLKNGDYFNLKFENKDSRILWMFMYWNLIEYRFPYKYVMDQKWDITLDKTLPLVLDVKNEDEFFEVIRKMSSKLDDSHVEFVIYSNKKYEGGGKFFPANCKIIEDKIVVTEILADSLAQADDIKVGDVITKINDKTVKELITEYRDLFCASNEPFYLKKVLREILVSASDNVKVEFLKEGKYTTKAMVWHNYHDSHRNEFKKGAKKKKEKFKLLDNNIGYVDMEILKSANVPSMIEALKSTKAIVFDLRNYPKGTYAEIAKFLNAEQKTFAIYTYPDFSYPGRFYWTKGSVCGSENKENYKGKVIVLLNEDSLSQSEWTAMCFQTAGNTTIIGSQTAGADGNVTELDFKGFHTRYSGIGVYYPDGRETQRIGIVPDIEVKPTIKGIQEGKDEVLDRALAFIETGK